MCLTCEIVAGKVVPAGGVIYRDEYVVLHHCLDVRVPGYLILSPVRHAAGYGDLSDEEIHRLGAVVKRAVNIMKEVEGVERVYVASFGEETAHFHLHLFPRYGWMPARHPEAANSRGQLDGARLLSICREMYKLPPEAMEQEEIVKIAARLRGRMGD